MVESQTQYQTMLGMPVPTATAKLKKNLMYHLADKLNMLNCLKCKQHIESSEELSIDHIKPWRLVSAELFWDLENLAFSHLKCNVRDRRITSKSRRVYSPTGTTWCSSCKEYLEFKSFSKCSSRPSGFNDNCKLCRKRWDAPYRQRKRDQKLSMKNM
jgi:hypothetical protein